MSDDFNYSKISPGVRDIVKWLRIHGFNTIDSGDGSNYKAGMECAIPERHVFIDCHHELMIGKALALRGHYPDAYVEVSWVPGERAIIALFPDGRPSSHEQSRE